MIWVSLWKVCRPLSSLPFCFPSWTKGKGFFTMKSASPDIWNDSLVSRRKPPDILYIWIITNKCDVVPLKSNELSKSKCKNASLPNYFFYFLCYFWKNIYFSNAFECFAPKLLPWEEFFIACNSATLFYLSHCKVYFLATFTLPTTRGRKFLQPLYSPILSKHHNFSLDFQMDKAGSHRKLQLCIVKQAERL